MKFSKLGHLLSSSSTMTATLKAKELADSGQKMIVATVGEPNDDVDSEIKDALIEFLLSQPSRYGSAQGLLSVREGIAAWMTNIYGVDYGAEQIAVTPGSKFALYALMQILCEPGDEVLIPAPYWVSYVTQAQMAGAKAVICEPNKDYKLSPETLKKNISEKTRLLILNSPNNPSGAVYSEEDLNGLYQVLISASHVTIICDDIYNELIFKNQRRAASLHDVSDLEFKKRIIIVHGVSKSFAMTGWRAGWVAAEKECIAKLTNFLSQTVTCIPDFIQAGMQKALQQDPRKVSARKNQLALKHAFVRNKLLQIPAIRVYASAGAFYVWIEILDQAVSSARIAEQLLTLGLAVVPGEAFGLNFHLRLSVTISEEELNESIRLLKNFFTKNKV